MPRAPRRDAPTMARATTSAGMARTGLARTSQQRIEERREQCRRASPAAAAACAGLTTGSAAGCRPRRNPARDGVFHLALGAQVELLRDRGSRRPTTPPRSGCAAPRAPPGRTATPHRRPLRGRLPASRPRAIVVPMQQNASCAVRPLSCSAMRSNDHDAIGELRMFLPSGRRVSAKTRA